MGSEFMHYIFLNSSAATAITSIHCPRWHL